MRIFQNLLTLFLISIISAGFSQETVINGTAPGAQGKTITLTAPADLITFWEEPIASTKVGDDGKFSLRLTVSQTMDAIMAINFHKAELFIEPGKTYRVKIDSINYNDALEINPFIQAQSLKLQVLFEDPYELNYIVGDFSGLYNTFVLDNFNALYRDRDKVKVDTFRVQMQARYKGVTLDYFNRYFEYKIASLEQLTRYYSAAEIGYRYFSSRPILYLNLEYMDLFNTYFTKYITVTSKALRMVDYNALLKGNDPYTALMKSLSADTLLKQEQLRELVLLKGLMEMHSMSNYKPDEVLNVIRMVVEKSKFPENRVVASNIVKTLIRLKKSTLAPGFTLNDREKKPVSLTGYLGKPVVLSFWTTYCQGCLGELDLLKPLYDKYKNRVNFISISADADFGKMVMFLGMKREYIWTFLHIGDQSEVLKNYDVRSYPLFVLIDSEGKIFKYPAALPGDGLGAEIEKMIQE